MHLAVDEILQLVGQDWHASCQGIAEIININYMTVSNHLKRAVYKEKLETAKSFQYAPLFVVIFFETLRILTELTHL